MALGNVRVTSLPLESRWDRLEEGSAALFIIGLFLGAALLSVALLIVPPLSTPRTDRAALERMLHETAVTHGIDPKAFRRTAQLESRLDPRAYHPRSKAAG